eukprot:jgi/Sobl393_1/17057/SZX60527.1
MALAGGRDDEHMCSDSSRPGPGCLLQDKWHRKAASQLWAPASAAPRTVGCGRLAAVAPAAPAAAGGEEASAPADSGASLSEQQQPSTLKDYTEAGADATHVVNTEQQQLRSGSPNWPWVQDTFSSSTANSSTANSSSTSKPASSSSSSSSSNAVVKLPLPSFWELPAAWDLPRQLAQLASMASPASTPPTTPEPISSSSSSKVGTGHQAGGRPHSPSTQRHLARSLASALRQMRPSSSSSSSSSSSKSGSSARNSSSKSGAATALDSATLAAAQLLQQVRDAASDAAWEAFVEGVQLQAADALQLTTVQASITASYAGDDLALPVGGSQDSSTAGAGAQDGSTASAADAYAAQMGMAGRHLITHIPPVTSSQASSMHEHQKQQQQQQQRRQHEEELDIAAGSAQHQDGQQQSQQQQQAGMQYLDPLASMRDAVPGHTAYDFARLQLLDADRQQQQQHRSLAAGNGATSHGSNKASNSKSSLPTNQAISNGSKHNSPVQDAAQSTINNGTSSRPAGQPQAAPLISPLVTYASLNSIGNVHEPSEGIATQQLPPAPSSSGSGSSSAAAAAAAFPKYEYLVFGGGGARCFGYAGALHALRQLGLLGRLRGVSGSSGGAVYALLAALRFSVPEVQAAMGTLPETETLSWLRLNSRLGLSDGEATFRQIEA